MMETESQLNSVPMIREYHFNEPQYKLVASNTPRTPMPVVSHVSQSMAGSPYQYQAVAAPNYITTTAAMNNQNAAIITQLPPIQSLTHGIAQQQQQFQQQNVVTRGSGSVSPVGVYTQHTLMVPDESNTGRRRSSINIGTLCHDHDEGASMKNSLPTPGDSTEPTSRKSSISSDMPVYNNGERYNANGELIGKTGKPLRNTKRAAQNRSAQKAFRQRREKYIKALEEKAKQYDSLLKENMELKNLVEVLKNQKPQSANMVTK